MLWNLFFSYAAYTSALGWMALFGFTKIRSAFKRMRARDNSKTGESINFQYDDQLNILQRSYNEVPAWWYIALFSCSLNPAC